MRMVGPLLEVIYFLHSTENFIDRENIKLLDNPVVDVRFYSLKEKISFKRQVNMLSDTLNKKYGLIISEEKKSEKFIVVKEDQSLFPIYADQKKRSSIKVEGEFIVFKNKKLSDVISYLRSVYYTYPQF